MHLFENIYFPWDFLLLSLLELRKFEHLFNEIEYVQRKNYVTLKLSEKLYNGITAIEISSSIDSIFIEYLLIIRDYSSFHDFTLFIIFHINFYCERFFFNEDILKNS